MTQYTLGGLIISIKLGGKSLLFVWTITTEITIESHSIGRNYVKNGKDIC